MQTNWSPSVRVLARGLSSTLAAYGVSRCDWPGTLLTLAGAGLALRAGTNLETKRLRGIPPRDAAQSMREPPPSLM